MTGGRVVIRGRRGTLVLATDRYLTESQMDGLVSQIRRGLARESRGVLVLDGGLRVEGIIPAPPRRSRAGHRPRWAR